MTGCWRARGGRDAARTAAADAVCAVADQRVPDGHGADAADGVQRVAPEVGEFAGEDLVEDYTQAVHIGGGGHAFAHAQPPETAHRGFVAGKRRAVALQQLGYALQKHRIEVRKL